MLSLFAEQLFRRDSILNQPMVGLPFVDSLVRGLLLAAEHPYRWKVYAYIVRAVTPGTFALPAVHVSDMYAPRVYARSAMGSVTIAPR